MKKSKIYRGLSIRNKVVYGDKVQYAKGSTYIIHGLLKTKIKPTSFSTFIGLWLTNVDTKHKVPVYTNDTIYYDEWFDNAFGDCEPARYDFQAIEDHGEYFIIGNRLGMLTIEDFLKNTLDGDIYVAQFNGKN